MRAEHSLLGRPSVQAPFGQKLIPGLVGLSVHTDCVYQHLMHALAAQSAPQGGSVSRLKLLLCSLDFAQLIDHCGAGRWRMAEQQIADAAAALKAGGADFVVICANTGYALAGEARLRVRLPILDIAEPVCRSIHAAGFASAGLISTLKTDESGLYQMRAREYGLQVISPPPPFANTIQRLILDELVGGQVSDDGLRIVRSAAEWFASHGADCLILGCTDLTHMIGRLESEGGMALPLFDSTRIHAAAAVRAAMSGELRIAKLE